MGYRAEKIEQERRSKRIKIILFTLLSAVVVAVCLFSFYCMPAESWKFRFNLPEISARKDGELRIHFIDVGQGDSTLIEFPDGKVALVDGGNGGDVETKSLMRYLNALDIERIDGMVATHADVDHCGGLATVLRLKEVVRAYVPAVENPTNVAGYADFYRRLSESDCKKTVNARGVCLSGEGQYPYKAVFLYPYSLDVESGEGKGENEDSAVIWLDYCGVSGIFCGDIDSDVERLLMRDDGLGAFDKWGVKLSETEILKVAHHGSASSTSAAFVKYLGIQTAVISCGKNNGYGHPSSNVLGVLKAAGAETYRTDEVGSVMIAIKPDGTYQVEAVG